jgi:hypothetical protein
MNFGSLDDFLKILKSKKKFENVSTLLGSKRPMAWHCWPGPTVKAARPTCSRVAYRPKVPGESALPRCHRTRAWRCGAVPAGSLVAEVENDGRGEHRCCAADVPGKEPRVGAHRGGGTTVGWRRDLSAMAVGGGGSSDGCWHCSEGRLWLCESEGEVRVELN